MPLPIQLGSLTTRLRNFFRIRGRLQLMLDEVVVPTVQVQDLTVGPYQAGVLPAAGTQVDVGGAGHQMVIMLSPSLALVPPLINTDDAFIGRSFSITELEIRQRAAGLSRLRIGTVPRGVALAATFTVAKNLLNVQQGGGLQPVPVVIYNVPAIPFVVFPVVQEWFHAESILATQNVEVPTERPETTIDRATALVIEFPLANVLSDVNVRGIYQEQAP